MAFVWTEKSIEWFVRAANETNYYQQIVNKVSHLLEDSTSVYDLGCGVGYLSMEMAKQVRQVIAIDINDLAISSLYKTILEKKYTNIIPGVANWHIWQPKQPADVVILSNCNGIINKLEKLGKLANNYIVSVLPYSNQKDSICKLVNNKSLYLRRETINEAIHFLKDNKIPYELIDCKYEFGQPFNSWEEAKEFLTFYYDLGSEQVIQEYLNKNLVKRNNDFYLPKTKQSGILIIKKLDLVFGN